MKKTTILIVDDHHLVRLGLQALLKVEPDFEVIGQAATADEAVALVERLRPQVVLMDLRLPGRSGVEACQDIKQRWPETHVIMLTSYADDELVLEAINAGAEGYVLKKVEGGNLVEVIRAVARGEAVLDSAVTQKLLAHVRQAEQELSGLAFRSLSEREIEVLASLSEGKTNAEIAHLLSLSEKTVGNHVSAILDKLGVTNRIEAATYAVRHHIERHRPDK
ncbi:MAG: DNA-binding response regulator [Anaerolineae bacterium]|nr:response regulator transcription factor [Anaerolineales bacterium]MCQ3975461.1 DNA-binding response regulator [Anaerolineae bacterium]